MEKQNIIIQTEFQGITLNVKPDIKHEWLLSIEDVAQGYEVEVSAIRHIKRRHEDELIHNEHFITVTNSHGNPRAGIAHQKTYWTKEGIIYLGFFIRSERAKIFRKWASKLILNHLEGKKQTQEIDIIALEERLLVKQKDLIKQSQTELIHTLKKDLLEAMQELIKQNSKQQFWQFWEYLNLMQSKLEERIEPLEPSIMTDQSTRITKLEERIEKLEPPQIEDLEEDMVFVYAIQQNKTTKHKLGWSSKPQIRKQNIISNSGEKMEIAVLVKMPSLEMAKALEDFLKGVFKVKQIKGEWYHLEEKDINLLKIIAEGFATYWIKNQ